MTDAAPLSGPFSQTVTERFPPPFDEQALRIGFERWLEEAKRREDGDPGLAAFMRAGAGDPWRPALAASFGNSPFLTACLLREPAFVRRLLTAGPDAAFDALRDEVNAAAQGEKNMATVMAALRTGKRRLAITAALADQCALWTLEQTTGALSAYADQALRLSAAHLLHSGREGGHIRLPHPNDPERDSGLVILAMGKLGARELNYSSDIDIIVLFDLDIVAYVGPKSPHDFFVRLTRSLGKMMEERTRDGYVFRTDLRLRPDPGSTALAISTAAAETYYEGFGQSWERAAMIKARAVAGDIPRGRAFIDRLRPFVWRKSLDFHAIRDIHAIKRRINAHGGGATAGVGGHDIKLGRGGVREIEFFAQTQQLIWGGRKPEVRCAATLPAIEALKNLKVVGSQARDDLARCYRALRVIEHRLQMIDDAQTQTLPIEPAKLARLACFMGFSTVDAFEAHLREILLTVERHYDALFEDAPDPSHGGDALVFTGVGDDPAALRALAGMGYANPQAVSGAIRGWLHGRYRCARSTRSRQLLIEITPALLRALGDTTQPDRAFLRFDAFLSGLPAGAQIFSLFAAQPRLLELLAVIMGDAPRLARTLAKRPSALDAMLTPDFLEPPPSKQALGEELDRLLAQSRAYEETLDLTRLWANDRKFQVGVRILRRLSPPRAAAEALSAIADVVLERMLAAAEADVARRHGRFEAGGLAVLALGKLGGREMTPTSDLDIVTVYDVPPDSEASKGDKPLTPGAYFTRLTQRLTGALSALTAEGRLYKVDLRLRPFGDKGPLAVNLESFIKYNAESAWTWEKLAQTRARVVCGPAALRARLEDALSASLGARNDPDKILREVAAMRERMARERKPEGPFDVKLARGGLVDVEFVVQYLMLRHGAQRPEILVPNLAEAIGRLREAGLLCAADADALLEAQDLWLGLQGMMRLCIEGTFEEEKAPTGFKQRLALAAAAPDFDCLKSRMDDLYAKAYDVYLRVIAAPALAAKPDPAGKRLGGTARRRAPFNHDNGDMS